MVSLAHLWNFCSILTNFSPLILDVLFCLALSWLLHFHGIIDHQIHELVEASDLALNSDSQLFVEPDLNCAVLLKELEDEVDRRKQDFALAAATSVGHCEKWLWLLM